MICPYFFLIICNISGAGLNLDKYVVKCYPLGLTSLN